ncbi:MAG: phosphate ABC transporter permease subunit PstC [Myxococcota bacterium]
MNRLANRASARRRAAGEHAATVVITAAGWFAVAVLLGILAVLVVNSFDAFSSIGLLSWIQDDRWSPDPYRAGEGRYGIFAMLAGTGYVTLGAMVLAVPIGIGAGAYLAEFATPWVREVVKPAIELLAAIPSVVVGFLGIVLVGPILADLLGTANPLNAANGAVLLAIMSLPTIVSITEDAISAVPSHQRNGSYALGAGRFETLWRVVLPGARSGIVAAVMLGLGRAVGETMTVLMATGNALAFPEGLTASVRTLTATIAIEMGEVPRGTVHYSALFVLGLVLFLITLLVNWVADRILARSEPR